MNFRSDYRFFTNDEHMSVKARKIRQIVQKEKDRNMLTTDASGWNSSVGVSYKVDRTVGEKL